MSFTRFTERDLRDALANEPLTPDARTLIERELARRESLEETQEVRRA